MNRHKILAVDDEQDVLFMLKKRLDAEGFRVITASDGRDAVTLARTQLPDLIILDIIMPGMDGSQVAQVLKDDRKTSHIPIIFLTALMSKTEECERDHVVADNYTFAKPIDTDALLEQINRLLCCAHYDSR